MKTTTQAFENDLKATVISCNSHRAGKPKIRRKCCQIAVAESDWVQKLDEKHNCYNSFKTVMTLYKSVKKYYLQVAGVCMNEVNFPRRNKIVRFINPEDFADILFDANNNIVYYSPLTENLIDRVFESHYLTEFEKNRWELAMVDAEEV